MLFFNSVLLIVVRHFTASKQECLENIQISHFNISENSNAILIYFCCCFLADTCPFWGPLAPLFCISGNVSSGFQSQSGFCLIHGDECNVHSLRSTLGATPAVLLMASITASHIPTCISRGETCLGFERAITGQKMNALPLSQRPGFILIYFPLYPRSRSKSEVTKSTVAVRCYL